MVSKFQKRINIYFNILKFFIKIFQENDELNNSFEEEEEEKEEKKKDQF